MFIQNDVQKDVVPLRVKERHINYKP